MSTPRDEDRLMDHKYDDIQEYDNPLPTWWNVIFWATIIWSIIYFLNVIPGVGSGKGRQALYEDEMAKAQELYGSPEQQAEAAIDEGAMAAALADPAKLEAGKVVFATTCSPCHNMDGGGNIGPNMTDDYWIHGNSPKAILTTITKGVPEKGMPTWAATLKPDQIANVAAYITTLRGTKPAVAKEPQGILMTPDGQPAGADSGAVK
ncbi:MAG: c-type cytochrome [Candidatus Eisenbacteria bacterium]|nr:c-type cytochrome [Candidatus Eisenbacteria bacterium]